MNNVMLKDDSNFWSEVEKIPARCVIVDRISSDTGWYSDNWLWQSKQQSDTLLFALTFNDLYTGVAYANSEMAKLWNDKI